MTEMGVYIYLRSSYEVSSSSQAAARLG